MNRLHIEINSTHVRLTESSASDQKVFSHAFSDLQDHRYIEQMDALLDEAQLKNRTFDAVVLSWSGYRTTLVPSNVFEDGNAHHFFELCFGSTVPENAIHFDRLQAEGIVNIYELPIWVKSYFSSRFPRIVLRHEGSHLIQHLLSSRFSGIEVMLTIHKGYFLLCIGQEDKLIYYSSFDYQELDDILYHVMFTLQQKELYNKDGKMQVQSGQGITEGLSEQLIQRISAISEMKSFHVISNNELVFNSLELCV